MNTKNYHHFRLYFLYILWSRVHAICKEIESIFDFVTMVAYFRNSLNNTKKWESKRSMWANDNIFAHNSMLNDYCEMVHRKYKNDLSYFEACRFDFISFEQYKKIPSWYYDF